ncbi:S1C family serine protease [Bacillus massiliigorillae]|uniref:S1C family serine protease n=1 Tax=Bacillus massiliigorillae TaxID=1243664 RepID=UPI0003A77A3D|nr:trypsin-like peptidase domain-containing protein [Bacillus massiliigorillae]
MKDFNKEHSEQEFNNDKNTNEMETVQEESTIKEEMNNEPEKIVINEEVKKESTTPPQQRKPKSGKSKGWMKTISAGVIGSVLTLSILPFTDYPEWINQPTNQTEQAISSAKDTGPVKVQQTSTATSNLADMVEKALPAIVGVVNIQQAQQNNFFLPQEGQQGQRGQQGNSSDEGVETGSGSGVIFKKDNKYAYIVTNNHVIENATEIEISLESGEKTKAQLIGTDALSDLAVLTIDAKYAKSTLSFGDSSALRVGEQVAAIGNPLGLDFSRSVTQGIISALDRSVSVSTSAGEWAMNVLQTDAAINAGNSGGALLNTAGQVIGINSLKISQNGVEGLGFAIPSNDVVPIINEIIKNGKVDRPYVGIGLASLDEIPSYYLQNLPQNVEGGVMVTSVDQNSAAGKAGLQVQDVIVSINGQDVKSSTEFRKYLYTNLKVGDKATLKIYRQGSLKTVSLTLTSNSGPTS